MSPRALCAARSHRANSIWKLAFKQLPADEDLLQISSSHE